MRVPMKEEEWITEYRLSQTCVLNSNILPSF